MPPGQFVSPSSERLAIQIFYGGNSTFINPLDKTKFFHVSLAHRRNTIIFFGN